MTVQPVSLETRPTDTELAERYRRDLAELFKPIVAIMNEARRTGLEISFNMSTNQYGISETPRIDVRRPL